MSSATVFAQVVGAIVNQLEAAPAVSARIHRARMRPLPTGAGTGVCVRIGRADLQKGVGQGVPYLAATGIAVECYARGPADSIDALLDALLQSAVSRLLADPTLGGLVGDLNLTGVSYDFDVDGDATGCAIVTFDVLHSTPPTTF
ncbi:MAG: hypothetical protein WBC18_07855 [Ottowia sp.]|uniref:hypothetical protein n=1 Tax=Ottowia sp. TaxID=1898956 RepID=UPI003C74C658